MAYTHRRDSKLVRASFVLFLMVATLFSVVCQPNAPVAASSPPGSDPVAISSLVGQFQGYVGGVEPDNYTYVTWTAYLNESGIPHYNNYLHYSPPQDFLLLYYNSTQNGNEIVVEVYGYSNTTGASNEYNYQTSGGKQGLIFQRISAVQELLHRGQFMAFIMVLTLNPSNDTVAKSTLSDFTQKFVNNLFSVIPESTQPPPQPVVNFTGQVVWGVQAGDTLNWSLNRTTVAGNVEEGGGIFHYSWTISLTVMEVSSDNLAILLRSPQSSPSDFDVMPTINLTLPAYSYFWSNVTSAVGDPASDSPYPLIFPMYVQGKTMEQTIGSHIANLQFTPSSTTVMCHYSTGSSPGFTPVTTETEDFTVHIGSGVTTGGSFITTTTASR